MYTMWIQKARPSKSDVTDEDQQPVDKDYDTVVDNRPQEIEFERQDL